MARHHRSRSAARVSRSYISQFHAEQVTETWKRFFPLLVNIHSRFTCEMINTRTLEGKEHSSGSHYSNVTQLRWGKIQGSLSVSDHRGLPCDCGAVYVSLGTAAFIYHGFVSIIAESFRPAGRRYPATDRPTRRRRDADALGARRTTELGDAIENRRESFCLSHHRTVSSSMQLLPAAMQSRRLRILMTLEKFAQSHLTGRFSILKAGRLIG